MDVFPFGDAKQEQATLLVREVVKLHLEIASALPSGSQRALLPPAAPDRKSVARRRATEHLAKADLLVLDDFGLTPMSDEMKRDLLEIVDDRFDKKSTLITSQLQLDAWHRHLNEATHFRRDRASAPWNWEVSKVSELQTKMEAFDGTFVGPPT